MCPSHPEIVTHTLVVGRFSMPQRPSRGRSRAGIFYRLAVRAHPALLACCELAERVFVLFFQPEGGLLEFVGNRNVYGPLNNLGLVRKNDVCKNKVSLLSLDAPVIFSLPQNDSSLCGPGFLYPCTQ